MQKNISINYFIREHSKEEPSLKLIFFTKLAHKTQSKYQNMAFLLVDIQIWTDFYALDMVNKMPFKLRSSLGWVKSYLLRCICFNRNKERQSLKVSFFLMPVCKNESKFECRPIRKQFLKFELILYVLT